LTFVGQELRHKLAAPSTVASERNTRGLVFNHCDAIVCVYRGIERIHAPPDLGDEVAPQRRGTVSNKLIRSLFCQVALALTRARALGVNDEITNPLHLNFPL
jgi:hypothetical protein